MSLAGEGTIPKFSVARTSIKRRRRSSICRRVCRGASLLAAAALAGTPALGTIYYVSPTGSDSNNGTSPATPWGSVTKVDDSYFQPGDQILFQYGSTWNASLDVSSSGTASAPIVYGAYGNPSLGNPTFSGGNTVSNSAFTLVSGTTYQTTSAAPVNCVYINGGFAAEVQDVFTQVLPSQIQTPAVNLSGCEATGNSFYYNAANGQLFVNPGSALTNQTIDLGTRQDAIDTYGQSNLIIRNLNTTETAADNGGYGVRIENSSNVTLMNSTVTNAGKHSVGAIDATGVTVTNVVANGSQPWLGFGGASAFVSYGDAVTGPLSLNDTSAYTNVSYTNPNGPYAIFISHGGANGIASVALNNLATNNNDATGISIQSTGANEVATISGGNFSCNVGIDSDNSIVNGATFSGIYGQLILTGSNSVVQNSVFNGSNASYAAGQNGAFQDAGANNTFRFNVLVMNSGPAITPLNSTSSTSIYGNIVVNPNNPAKSVGIGLLNYTGGDFNSNYNLYLPNTLFELGDPTYSISAAQWQSLGNDINSLFAIVSFNNSSGGDFSLQPGSAGTGLVPASEISSTLATANSLLGSPAGNGNYNAGLNPYISTNLSLVTGSIIVNNPSVMTVIDPIASTLAINNTGSLIVLNTATLDLACNVNTSGSFVSTGSLIVTGNFNNSGTAYVSGPQLWSPGTVFTNLAGSAVFATDAGGSIAPVGYLTINASGGSVTFASSQHLAGLNILAGATVQVASQPTGSPSIVFTPSLTVTGVLDLTNNDLIVQSGNLAAVTAMIRQGYNNGNWNGTGGILSSTAAADTAHLTALGVIQNTADGTDALYGYNGVSLAPLGLFDGAIPNSTDVLVKLTYYGDANLDGKVDGTDYSLIDNGFLNQLTVWYNGDFNYDGIVDGSDYTLIDNAFNQQGASLAASPAAPSAGVTTQVAGPTSVPEPAMAGVLALGLLSVRRGRRRGGFNL